ncbi:MAG: ABC transporter ATP-binding protein [Sediminibacterium sp.]|nr:ABC transporter ATP-binding protein [Sediminibacterium sp.]TXT33843.1 MAG: lipopolysaccharide transport system ATP-binding protein [Chitinophagaceae bacterium]
MSTVIKVENLSKQYRLGDVGTGTLSHDLKRWWYKTRGKEDPYLQIGETNDRATKGVSDYVWALKDINFEVKAGEVLGIIGRNGAGKSTLLKILSKTTTPTTGSIKVKGRIASLLEVGTGFHPELTGRENIYLNGAILGMTKREIQSKFDEIVDFSGVERYIDTPVKRYSSGMYVRLAFAVAAHLEPEILIVDEVLAVGDAEFQKKALGKMKDVSEKSGRTVLFVSHSMPTIKNICNSAFLLVDGTVYMQGTSDEVVDSYLNNFIEFDTSNRVIINENHRKYDLPKKIKYLSFEFVNQFEGNQYSIKDNLEVKIILKSTLAQKNFRISFSINKIDESIVGLYFSDEILNIEANQEKSVTLKIKDHQLSKGQYYFDFSVGTGNQLIGITEYDNVSKILFFEIAYNDLARKEMITLWPSNWGNISFQNVEIL